MVSSAIPSQKIAKGGVISDNVKVSEATRTAPGSCKQSKYDLYGVVPSVGALGWNAAFHELLVKMASVEHLQKQGKTPKWRNLLVHELYVIVTQHSYSSSFAW